MSNLVVSNISDGSTSVATGYVVNGSAKQWVNLDQTGTAAIEDSLNCSSITDNGTGWFTINFSNNMANVNYSMTSSANNTTSFFTPSIGIRGDGAIYKYAGNYQISTAKHDAGVDCEEACMAVFGDLA